MAQRVHIELVDDLDGTTASETVNFSIDSTNYEIDLSKANAKKLRDALAPWTVHARKVTARRAVTTTRKTRARGGDTNEIRQWAVSQGLTVSKRGRVSAEIREAYENANK